MILWSLFKTNVDKLQTNVDQFVENTKIKIKKIIAADHNETENTACVPAAAPSSGLKSHREYTKKKKMPVIFPVFLIIEWHNKIIAPAGPLSYWQKKRF